MRNQRYQTIYSSKPVDGLSDFEVVFDTKKERYNIYLEYNLAFDSEVEIVRYMDSLYEDFKEWYLKQEKGKQIFFPELTPKKSGYTSLQEAYMAFASYVQRLHYAYDVKG